MKNMLWLVASLGLITSCSDSDSDNVIDDAMEIQTVNENRSPISIGNVEPAMVGLASIFNDNPLQGLRNDIEYLSRINFVESTDRTLNGTDAIPDGILPGNDRTYVLCNAGGRYTHDDFGGQFGNYRLILENCQIGDSSYSGTAVLNRRNEISDETTFDNFSVDGNDGNIIRIEHGYFNPARGTGRTTATYTIENTDFTIESAQGTIIVNNWNQIELNFSNSADLTELDTSFEVSAPWTNNIELSVSTTTSLTGAGVVSGNYTAGAIALSDGSDSLVIDVDSGNQDTYAVTATVGDSVTTDVFTWTEKTSFGCVAVLADFERIDDNGYCKR